MYSCYSMYGVNIIHAIIILVVAVLIAVVLVLLWELTISDADP